MQKARILSAALIGCLGLSASAQVNPTEPGGHPERPEPKSASEASGPDTPAHEDQDVLRHRRGAHGTEKAAYLGIATSPPAPALREQLKLSRGMGLVVEFVEPGSPAEAAGLKPYDVLTLLNDQRLINSDQLAVLVRSLKPDDEVELTLIRQGERMTVKAKLVEKELPMLEDQPILDRFLDQHVMPMLPGGHPAPPAGTRPHIARPVPPPHGATISTTVWTDGEHTLTLVARGPHRQRRLIATDKNGAVLYDGAVDHPETREKLPTVVAEKLKRMEGSAPKHEEAQPPPRGPEGGKPAPPEREGR